MHTIHIVLMVCGETDKELAENTQLCKPLAKSFVPQRLYGQNGMLCATAVGWNKDTIHSQDKQLSKLQDNSAGSCP